MTQVHLKERIRRLNDQPLPSEKSCVLYVMGRDQRLHDNHALSLAQEQALKLEVPLAVIFHLQARTGQRAREHYQFMLEGLREVEKGLQAKNIAFLMVVGEGNSCFDAVFYHFKPQLVVFDFSPLRGPLAMHKRVADHAKFPVLEVDTHNIVPVWQASDKQEIAARTLRPRIHRHLADNLEEAKHVKHHPYTWPGSIEPVSRLQPRIDTLLDKLPQNHSDISRFKAGEQAAHQALKNFIELYLEGYNENRNKPPVDGQSELSPYLHFGQLSAAEVVRAVQEAAGAEARLQVDADTLIEELVVRKELSDNFCYYNRKYDQLAGAPEWARNTLEKHAKDPRENLYSRQQFEEAKTHDLAWNAAQRQLLRTGKIHGYMRMYWAKKVLEWSKSPQDALETLLYLNDFYHLDGGDPNGYVGILWSIAGLHDRPWGERPIYGVVRSMVYAGLKRKFDIEAYIKQYS